MGGRPRQDSTGLGERQPSTILAVAGWHHIPRRYHRDMTPGTALGCLETDAGRTWVAATDQGVVAIDRGESPLPLLGWLERRLPGANPEIRPSPMLDRAAAAIRAGLDGDQAAADTPIDATGATPFERAVWTAVRAIPYGSVATYGEVAAAAGRPQAARAVGRVMARCPLWPIVPCHRVVRADGALGGWGADPAEKRRLLELERRRAPGSAATSWASPARRPGPSRRPPVPSRSASRGDR